MSKRRKPQPVTLTIRFPDEEAMLDWARVHTPDDVEVFPADALDPEFDGRAPAGTYVLRNKGGARL